jgi:pimeloyl-ACP methyl ester carboxylesterase
MKHLFLTLMLAGTTVLSPAGASAAPSTETAATVANQHVKVGKDRIAYRRIGSGPTILLANRLRGTLDTWDPLFLDALAKRYTVVTFDYPGIGYSEGSLPDDMGMVSRFIDDFATAIQADRFVILGWSWGGLAAQTYLLDHPERVTQAILVGTSPPGHNEIPLQQAFLERAFKPINDLADEEVLFFEPASEVSRALAKASHDRIYARPDVASRIPSTPEAFAPYFKAADGFHKDPMNRREQLAKARLPILVISGDHDPSTAGQNWFPLIGKMGNAQFVFFSETGHAPQHQHPELAAHYIHDFIAKTSHSIGQ